MRFLRYVAINPAATQDRTTFLSSNLPTYQNVLTYRYAKGGTNVTGDHNSRRDIWDQTEKQSSSGQLNEECQGFSAGGFCVDLAIHPQDENGRRAAN